MRSSRRSRSPMLGRPTWSSSAKAGVPPKIARSSKRGLHAISSPGAGGRPRGGVIGREVAFVLRLDSRGQAQGPELLRPIDLPQAMERKLPSPEPALELRDAVVRPGAAAQVEQRDPEAHAAAPRHTTGAGRCDGDLGAGPPRTGSRRPTACTRTRPPPPGCRSPPRRRGAPSPASTGTRGWPR